jgi:sugar (pentulose or hexulose) kinase
MVLADVHGAPLAPAISWTDRRTEAEARAVIERLGHDWLLETTGMVPIAGTSLTHLLWLRRHEPEAWRQTQRILAPKDWVLGRLAGTFATDCSTPSRSMMFDVRQGDWSTEVCEAFEIDIELLAPIRERPWEKVAELPVAAAEELGLPVGLPVAMGGADDAAATLGGGAIDVGEICVGTGTGRIGAAFSTSRASTRTATGISPLMSCLGATSSRWRSRAPARRCAGCATPSPARRSSTRCWRPRRRWPRVLRRSPSTPTSTARLALHATPRG